MADLPISSAATLTATTLATGDLIPVVDISAGAGSKGSKITADELKKYVAASTPGVAYIQTNGNNTTAELGNPAKPYLTVASAIAAAEAASQTHITLVCGRGTFVADAILTSTADSIFLTGAGVGATVLNALWVGEPGLPGASGEPPTVTDGLGGESFDGGPILKSDGSLKVNFDITAGIGGVGGENTSETGTGGGGGSGGGVGAIELHGVVAHLELNAGAGGFGGSGPEGPGSGGSVGLNDPAIVKFCDVTLAGDASVTSFFSIVDGVAT